MHRLYVFSSMSFDKHKQLVWSRHRTSPSIWKFPDLAVATRSGKQTHSEGQMQIVECGLLHRQAQGSLLSAKDPDQFLEKPYILQVFMPKSTSPNSQKLVWTKEKKDTELTCDSYALSLRS